MLQSESKKISGRTKKNRDTWRMENSKHQDRAGRNKTEETSESVERVRQFYTHRSETPVANEESVRRNARQQRTEFSLKSSGQVPSIVYFLSSSGPAKNLFRPFHSQQARLETADARIVNKCNLLLYCCCGVTTCIIDYSFFLVES